MDEKRAVLLQLFSGLPHTDQQAIDDGLQTGTFKNVPAHVIRILAVYLRAARVTSDALSAPSSSSTSKR